MKKSRFILAAVFAIIFVMLFAFTASASENPVSLDGIQIRINEPYGIRYIATVEGATSDYDEVGMLVIPTEKLSGELTLDTPKVGKITSKSQDFRYFSESNDHFQYTLCLIGLENEHYGVEYVVRPYVVFTTDGGEQQTVYAETYKNYALTPAKITEKVLENYADMYCDAIAQDHEKLDDRLTEYNRYLDELAASEDEEEDEEEIVTETIEYITLNEFYWTLGTLGSSDGTANPANHKRIFTPGYIPAENTVITFDGTSGVQYIVMEYDADKNWLCTSGWITKDTYAKKNEKAAYYRCVLTNNTTLDFDDIPGIVAHLTINVSGTLSGAPVDFEFKKGTIAGATGAPNPASANRIYTPDMYPSKGLVLNYSATDLAKLGITILGYNADGSFVKTYGDRNAATINVEEIAQGAEYVRLVIKLSSSTATDDNANSYADACLSGVYATDINHSFFELGNIDASGVGENDATCKFASSSEYAHTVAYIPTYISASFDAKIGGSYVVSYYDSAYSFVSATESLTSASLPQPPANAAYYRLAIKPGYNVTEASVDFAASAFKFTKNYTLTTSDWAVGTISGGDGKENTSNNKRIYTPGYYLADGMTVSYVTNANATAYVLLAYAADKSFLGTSGDERGATYDVKSEFPNAVYYRFAIKTVNAMTKDTISTVSDHITITESSALFERKGLDIEVEPSLGTFSDEGLICRFGMTSVSSYSPGNYQSGMCEVEDELWLFSTSDKGTAGDGKGVIMRYKPDWENGTARFLGAVTHNFGHANSVDYSSENKCFIVGNGSGSFSNTENYFYVYNNAYELVKSGATELLIEDENCITYNWKDTGISYRTKLNTCWYGKNSAFVGANNNGFVYKVALGTGDRILALGTAKQVAEDEFNGTWQIIKEYAQADNYDNAQASGFRGQGYDQCNQGTDYADGTLYLTCGHDGVYFWRCRLDSDGAIKRDEFHKYMVVGSTTNTGAISGIICHGDYLIFTNGGYINVYLNSALK